MLLYYEAGFPMEDILQIATINGANVIDQGNNLGSIEKGRPADIVIFEKDPFENYKNLLSIKAVIKSGRIYKSCR